MLEEEISTETVEALAGRSDGDGPDLEDPVLYFNRELSWLDFNERVLELAEESSVPLLERVKFCAIYASNLDEFIMVRVAGLFDQVDAGIDARGPDGLSPGEQIDAIQERVLELDARLSRCFNGTLRPALEEEGIRIVPLSSASDSERAEIDQHFHEQVFPALTPLVIGLGRPFPYISNLSLSLGVLLRDPDGGHEVIARVKVPKELLGRFLPIGEDGTRFVALEDVIAANLDALFPGTEVIDHGYFRVTRDADFTVSDEADDLLQAVQDEIRARRFGEVVRLEIAGGMNPTLRQQLIEALRLEDREVYEIARADRPCRPLGHRRRPGALGAALRALVAGHPAEAAGRRGRGGGHLLGDPQRRPAGPPSLRLVLELGRALRRAGRRRSGRAGDQADRVPDQR